MKITSKVLAAIAFLALSSGAAYAADAVKKDCCADCCKEMKHQHATPDHK